MKDLSPDQLAFDTYGATDAEIVAAGLGAVTSKGNLIDSFRDRLVFPIYRDEDVAGFIARRNPRKDDDAHAGPKYLIAPMGLLNAGLYAASAEIRPFPAHRSPSRYFTANPQASSARTTVDNWPGHVRVSPLVQVHRICVAQAEHSCDLVRVHQFVNVD